MFNGTEVCCDFCAKTIDRDSNKKHNYFYKICFNERANCCTGTIFEENKDCCEKCLPNVFNNYLNVATKVYPEAYLHIDRTVYWEKENHFWRN